jgi:hypothetical protein
MVKNVSTCQRLIDVALNTISRRTKAEQEVLALIAPLGKLGCFEEAADFFSS